MKVAVVVPGFSVDEQDWCIPILLDVLREMAQQAEIHVFTLRHPPQPGSYRVHGIQVRAIGGGTTGGIGRVRLLAAAIRQIVAEHRTSHFDVIHGLWADEPGAVAVTAGRLLRMASIVSVMGGELVGFPDIGYGGRLSRANRLLTALSLRFAGRITAGSEIGVEQARDVAPAFQRQRVLRLTWGVDPGLFPQSAKPVELAGSFRVLSVGSLVPVKDHATLLRAIAELRERVPGVHLHLAGDGPLRSQLAARAGALGIADAVTLHGAVPREQLAGYYRAADVLAISSHHEMQPVVALEAAICGLAVAGTPVGLLPEIGAALAPVGDHLALARAIDRARSLPEDVARDLRSREPRVISDPALHNSRRGSILNTDTAFQLMQLYGSMVRDTGVTDTVYQTVSPLGKVDVRD